MSMKGQLISAIVPAYNSKQTLAECLDAILASLRSCGSGELIVVDNGSTDGSYELLLTRYAGVARITQRKGGTISALRNYGAMLAKGQILCFIDSDCVVSPAHFERAVAVMSTIRPAATGCKCIPPSPSPWVERTWYALHARSRDGFVSYLNSGNFVIAKSVFESVGGFDESLVTDEDAELGQRLRSAGFTIFECHDLAAIHLRNPKTIAEFFRKEVWRGTGLFRAPRGKFLDKVLVATLLHFILILIAMASPLCAFLSWPVRISVILFLPLLVPFAAVCFRFGQLKRIEAPLRALLLYFIWFGAKTCSMVVRTLALARVIRA